MFPSLPGYLALAALTGLTLWSIARPQPGAWWQRRRVFAGLLGLTIVAAHAPTLGFRQELANPDEAQLLAGALTLRHHFAPWLSVDLSTAGPVSVLPLFLAPADFLGARWCAALCSAAAVVGCFLALTCVQDNPAARIAALPVAAFFAFMQRIEFFQFSTEHMATVLLAAAMWIWMAATAAGERPPRAGPAFGFGLCLGGAVMSKLQSAPCAAWLAVATGCLLLLDARIPWPRRIAVLAVQAAGCCTIPLCFGLLAVAQGVLPDLLNSYGLNNVHYVTSINHDSAAGYQPAMIWGLNYLLKPVFAVLLACLVTAPAFTPAERRTGLVAAGLLASAIFAVVLPGRGFGHYWFLVLGPVLLASGTTLAPAGRWLAARGPRQHRWGLLALVPVLLGPPVAHRLWSSRDAALAPEFTGQKTVQGAGEKLRALARPGDTLTVWGWRAELHVYSQLPQGTREAHTQWLIQAIPQRDYYRQRFLADLARTQPRFIADAVGPRGFGFTDRATAGHEIFPAFTELLAQHYAYLGETEDIRLYVRHEN